MDRNRGNFQKQSRFAPSNMLSGPPSAFHRPPPMLQQPPLPPPQRQTYQQQPVSHLPLHPLNEEQLAFELEFKKWEKSFSDWQKAYANHPDRVSYKQYEQKFLQVRDKLMIKRAQIYSKTVTERKLENELGAAAAMANDILQKFGEPSSSRPIQMNTNFPPPLIGQGYNTAPMKQRSRSPYCNKDPPGRGEDSRGQLNDRNLELLRERWRDEGNKDRDQRSSGRGGRDNRSDSRDSRGDSRGSRDRRSDSRDNWSDSRDRRGGGRDQRGGRDEMRGGRDFRGGGRDQRGGGRDQRGGGRDQRGRQFDRRDRSREYTPMRKPSEMQLRKELEQKNVYPNVPWIVQSFDEKPPLVGKRKKKRNAKIEKVLEMKGTAGNGEVLTDDGDSKKFDELLSQAIKAAENKECPNRLSGAARKKLVAVKKKKQSDLTEEDKRFLEYAEFTRKAREDYFKNINTLRYENATLPESTTMDA